MFNTPPPASWRNLIFPAAPAVMDTAPQVAKANRPYQDEAIAAIRAEYQSGIRRTLLVMATGLGKTHIFSQIAAATIRRGKRVLCLAHREELIGQGVAALAGLGVVAGVEQAKETAHNADVPCVFASVQSLARPKRLERYAPDEFGLVIVDEAHHAPAKTYRDIIQYFDKAHVLGVTATPVRLDGVGMHNIFESVAYQMPIAEGIEQGWLCPVRGEQIQVEGLTLESLKITKGDFDNQQIEALLMQEGILQRMVVPTIEKAGGRQTIVFAQSVEHAHAIAECFKRGGATATVVDGGMDKVTRKAALLAYESKQAQYIINVGVLAEGYDYPPTACVALYRPTKSIGLLAQMLGRGTRNADGKSDCLILDFVGMDKTVETVNLLNVLDGSAIKAEVKDLAQKLMDEGADALTALTQAQFDIAQLAKIQARLRVNFNTTACQFLDLFGLPSVRGKYGGQPATVKQIEALQKMGVQDTAGLQKGEAVKLLGELFNRRDQGLCTLKQARYLIHLGCADPWDMSFVEAGQLISELKEVKHG